MSPNASVSLDMDNLWSYLKTHGDPTWESRPSYLEALVPRMLELFDAHSIMPNRVFVVGADAAREDGQKAVAAINEAGHEVGNHSYEHEPWLHTYDRGRLEESSRAQRTRSLMRVRPARGASAGPVTASHPSFSSCSTTAATPTMRARCRPGSAPWHAPTISAPPVSRRRTSSSDRPCSAGAREGLRPVHPYR